jgi:hypothetical protein
MFQVNGTNVTLPYNGNGYTISYVGDSVRLLTSFWLSVQFNGRSKAEVKLPSSEYSGKLRGMCGANTGYCYNDYVTAYGQYVGSWGDNEIGNSYVVDDPDVIDPR